MRPEALGKGQFGSLQTASSKLDSWATNSRIQEPKQWASIARPLGRTTSWGNRRLPQRTGFPDCRRRFGVGSLVLLRASETRWRRGSRTRGLLADPERAVRMLASGADRGAARGGRRLDERRIVTTRAKSNHTTDQPRHDANAHPGNPPAPRQRGGRLARYTPSRTAAPPAAWANTIASPRSIHDSTAVVGGTRLM